VKLQLNAYGPALDALNVWGRQIDNANWADTTAIKKVDNWNNDTDLSAATEEDSVSVTPLSVALNNSLSTVAILLPDQQYPVVADLNSTFAATGQLKVTDDASDVIRTVIDPNLPALKADGTDQAALPWQALYPLNEYVCKGNNESASRAFARFILRINEQTQDESYYITKSPEAIRLLTAGVIEKGLPTASTSPQ